jgi:hypothetical protein
MKKCICCFSLRYARNGSYQRYLQLALYGVAIICFLLALSGMMDHFFLQVHGLTASSLKMVSLDHDPWD